MTADIVVDNFTKSWLSDKISFTKQKIGALNVKVINLIALRRVLVLFADSEHTIPNQAARHNDSKITENESEIC